MMKLDRKRWKEKTEFPLAVCTSHKATVPSFFPRYGVVFSSTAL